jgi:hypothetical protein
MGRIVEVEKVDVGNETSYTVTNDWHCPNMVNDEMIGIEEGEQIIFGPIFQRLSSMRCATFYNNKFSWEESCVHCQGIENMADKHAINLEQDMFVCFCDKDYNITCDEFREYINKVTIIKETM